MSLTPEQLRAIDVAVAGKVMGWRRTPASADWRWYDDSEQVVAAYGHWHPSVHASIALGSVVESMLAKGWSLTLHILKAFPGWRVEFWNTVTIVNTIADTAAVAVCLAALKACGVDTKEWEESA